MPDFTKEMREALERMRARAESPEFQAQVARLESGEASPEEKRRQAWKRQGIPAELWDAFDRYGGEAEACKLVDSFLESDERFILLAGEAGLAKTYAACRALAMHGGRYIRAYDVAQAWGDEDEGWLCDLRLASLVVMDEIGREPLDEKGWAYGKIYDLLDRRQANLRKTILVTNLGLDAFKARYCPDGRRDPLYDRIANRGVVPTPLTGSSLRRRP
jgi:DNA replication protein DnaC